MPFGARDAVILRLRLRRVGRREASNHLPCPPQETQRAQTEQMIEADVRNAMQSVRSVEARLAAAAAQRLAADQQYTSEQRKFQAGMSTVYLVLQRQTDLVVARGKELQAQTDLNKAIADFQRAIGNTFRYRNVAVISDGLRLEQTEMSAGER